MAEHEDLAKLQMSDVSTGAGELDDPAGMDRRSFQDRVDSPVDLASTGAGAVVGDSAAHSEAVVRLFSQHQRWLFVYLTTLLGNADDAEDVMQEVCVVMWKEHQQFQLGTHFASWLGVIAYHQVQKFWRKQKQKRRYLDTVVIEQLAEQLPRDKQRSDERRQMLRECLQALRDRDRDLVAIVYNDQKRSMREIAKDMQKPEGAIYKTMARIRQSLYECIRRKMVADGAG